MTRTDPRAPSPFFKLLRLFGICCHGVKGADALLRACHDPDKRQSWWIEAEVNAIWGGPKLHLETRWFTEWTAYFYGSQDRAIHRWILNNCRRDWTALDVGMNFGFFTCLLAQNVNSVHAFEPVDFLIPRAQVNCRLNGFTNVQLNEIALSQEAGEVTFYRPPVTASNCGTGSLLLDRSAEKVVVQALTLDAYVAQNGIDRIDFIKIDTEGAEHLVLKGACNVLRQMNPIIILERNETSFAESSVILEECGYQLTPLQGTLADAHDIIARKSADA